MKHLGKIPVDLFYRHFSQDSLKYIKEVKSIKSLKIITYVPISSFKSTFKFIDENFISKSDEVTIIFGLTGLNYDLSQEQLLEEITSIGKHSNKKLNIYVHTRCHIKMLLADDNLLLGTQNISSTSCSFSELSRLNYNNVFSNHELIMMIYDKEQKISNSIIDELIKDSLSCFNIIRNGIQSPFDYNEILKGYDYKTILEHMNIIYIAADEIYRLNNKIDTSRWELELEDCVKIVELCKEIHDEHDKEYYVEKLSELLLLLTGEDSYLREELNSNFDFVKSLEKIKLLSDNDILNVLINIFTEIKITDIDDEYFYGMLTKIKDIIFHASVFDKELLVEHMSHEVINQIEGSLGDYDLSKYIDNDANISRNSIQEAIYNNEISLDRLVYTLAEHIKKTSIDIIEIILSVFKEITNNRIIKANEILEMKIKNVYSHFKATM
ncbi:hypothetical protein [Aeromonas veronii]|uniref:hypothetical protein n=1 Tax=Aeromonas veronii TaxID=654 RepID=UPI00123C0DDB|nr:hypothetical protein [Aeromonas veronii]QET79680.1 hypothetical protein FOB40_10630 [Aeromonas veronii]